MNYGMIVYILGTILKAEAILMSLPALVAFLCGEGDLVPMLAAILIASGAGLLFTFKKPKNTVIYAKEGFVVTALSWVVMSLVGALPFVFAGAIPSYIDAVFETVSGFTTTGASILTDVEGMSRGLLFWRSFTHWIGGMGVLVFVMMVMPMENDNSMHLVRAEVPGPTAGKLVPRMRTTSMILYGIYGVMTLVLAVLLCLFGMAHFDSFCIAFGTAGTGGFAVSSAGIAGYGSLAIEVTLGVFMLLFGVNFSVYHLVLLRKFREAFSMEEVRVYLVIVAAATGAIAWNILSFAGGIGNALRQAFFQVSSIITTSGFATVDFEFWPEFSKHMLLLLMVVGACAGSTGGGMKVSRVLILVKSFVAEIRQIINPKAIVTVRVNGKPVDKKTLSSTRIYAASYMLLLCVFTLIVSLDGLDFTTNFTAVLSCFNNIGPGLAKVGPMANFSVYSDWAQVVLSLAMLTGRLEIFPMFLLFAKSAHDR